MWKCIFYSDTAFSELRLNYMHNKHFAQPSLVQNNLNCYVIIVIYTPTSFISDEWIFASPHFLV